MVMLTNLLLVVMFMTLVTVILVPASVLNEHRGFIMGWLIVLTALAVCVGWGR